MGEKEEALRAVLDSNVVLSSILFPHGRLTWLRETWRAGALTPLYSRDTAAELVRVLRYLKFRLTLQEVEVLLSDYLPFAELGEIGGLPVPRLPRCSVSADQKFLTLVAAGKAEVLVTGDAALRKLAGRTPFAIETPAQFRSRFS